MFSGFSTEKGPGAGSELTVQDLFECAAELKTNKAPAHTTGVPPKQIFNVKKSLTNTFVGRDTDLSNEAMRSGFVGSVLEYKSLKHLISQLMVQMTLSVACSRKTL